MHFVQRSEIIDGSECHPTCIKSLLSRNVLFICFVGVFFLNQKEKFENLSSGEDSDPVSIAGCIFQL